MKTIGILAVIVGLLELLNTLGAAVGAGRGGTSGVTLVIFIVTIAVAAALLASGVALLARGPRAITFARGAALACLVVFAALAAIRPGFSIASMLLGIAFPIVMLLVIRRTTQRSTPAMG
jgi:hypothetical protein